MSRPNDEIEELRDLDGAGRLLGDRYGMSPWFGDGMAVVGGETAVPELGGRSPAPRPSDIGFGLAGASGRSIGEGDSDTGDTGDIESA